MNSLDLKAFRVIFNLSQQEAAQEIGNVSQRSWAYWESGERTIPTDVVEKCKELLNRRKQTLEQVKQLGKNVKRLAVIFYDSPSDSGMSLLEMRYNNALASYLAFEYGANLVKFNPQSYIDWLTDNGLIDSPQKRSEWAVYQVKYEN